MNIFDREIKAVIFDMDGTLIDSTGIWKEIDKEFFKKRGINEVPLGYAEEIVHMGLTKGAQMTIETYGFANDTVEGVIKEWQDASIEQYKKYIQLKPYAKEAINFFKHNGVKVALATANDKELYEPCLIRLGLDNIFDFIIDVNQAKEGKSTPKIYDLVCEVFGTKRDETIVIEDTLVGLSTAYNAGFFAIGVDDLASRNCEKQKQKFSHKYIYSLKEIFEN